jgi:hypothetical protein
MALRWLMVIGVALIYAVAGAPQALADGLPVLGATGPSNGVASRGGARRYRAVPRARTTLVSAVSMAGRVQRTALLPGRFDVPVVAYDGTPSGLSADGRTLVLIRPRLAFPQRGTELAVLDARTLRPRRLIPLHGDFSFDALSPNGDWIVLIQYTSAVDPTRYRVRALNAATGRLRPGAIVDPTEADEAMRGSPITRATSPDGRWAYTLYDGNGRPFVHALDTAALTARCIDVPSFPASLDPWSARLVLAAGRLSVVAGGRDVGQIDTRTLALVAPTRRARARPVDPGPADGADTLSAALPVAAFTATGVAIVLLRRRYRPLPGRSRGAP